MQQDDVAEKAQVKPKTNKNNAYVVEKQFILVMLQSPPHQFPQPVSVEFYWILFYINMATLPPRSSLLICIFFFFSEFLVFPLWLFLNTQTENSHLESFWKRT